MKNLNVVFFFFLVSCALKAQSPNILLVILDDIGVGEIPRYEPLTSTKANMPNLEALMDRGLTFDNVWSSPACAPSRAKIITGKYGFRTNVLNPQSLSTLSKDETSLQQYIANVTNDNYATSLIGKWHLGGGGMNSDYEYPNDMGIDYFAGILTGGVQDYSSYMLIENMQARNTNEYMTTKLTDLTIDWIGAQDSPWFCWLAYTAPHSPYHLPPLDLHSSDNLSPAQAAIDADPIPYFHAMTESVDTEMGRVINSLSQEELDNTVIIVVGDNGTPRNTIQRPYRAGQAKGSLFQGGVHVPMVVAGKNVTRSNERETALVSFSDLFSTIVEMTGSDLDQYENSYSFYDLLSSEGEGQRDCMYTDAAEDLESLEWASRDKTYKYILMENGTERFYNLIDDPYEANTLLPNLDGEQQAAYDKLSQVKTNLVSVSETPVPLDFKLYPSPAKDYITLAAAEKAIGLEYQILNISGERLSFGLITDTVTSIKLDRLSAGSYIFLVNNTPQKFVKVD